MIVLDQVTMNVTSHARTSHARTRAVLSSVNLVIPSDRRIALLGPSNEDKNKLINLLGGVILPSKGRVVKKVNVSFPVGQLAGFLAELPVRKNVAHLARLYDVDVQTMVDFVGRVAELGPSFDKPYGLLSSQARRRLGRIIAYSIPFDLYVLTEEIVPGRKKHEDISYKLFQTRSRTAGMIIPSYNPQFVREYCDMGMVLDRGELSLYDNIEQALAASRNCLGRHSLRTV